MKKKLISIFMIIIALCLMTSCSFFEGENEGVKDIEFVQNEDQQNVIRVIYYNGEEPIKEEIIPSGVDGKDGKGIDVLSVIREGEAHRNKIEILLTDGESKTFYVPDGVRIESVSTSYDEGTDKHYMYLEYSDGSKSDAIEIPEGKPGNGIEKFEAGDPDELGNTPCTITFTDGTTFTFDIPAGVPGEGIEFLEINNENGRQILKVTLTSGAYFDFALERSAHWFKGNGSPESNLEVMENALIGDYYFDVWGKKIYGLTENGWGNPIVDFQQLNDTFTVTFNLNDENDPDHKVKPMQNEILVNNAVVRYGVKYGEYILNVPTPERDGYKFVGWATQYTVTPTTGFFTDLTPVFKNIVLYAIWEKIN